MTLVFLLRSVYRAREKDSALTCISRMTCVFQSCSVRPVFFCCVPHGPYLCHALARPVSFCSTPCGLCLSVARCSFRVFVVRWSTSACLQCRPPEEIHNHTHKRSSHCLIESSFQCSLSLHAIKIFNLVFFLKSLAWKGQSWREGKERKGNRIPLRVESSPGMLFTYFCAA